jgi:hypothetical protein
VQWLEAVERVVRAAGATVLRGGDFDRWDLEVLGGMFGSCRVRVAVEEHGTGRQLVRFWSWPRQAPFALALVAVLTAVATDAALSGAHTAFAFLVSAAGFVGFQLVQQCGAAMAAIDAALRQFRDGLNVETRDRAGAPPMRAELEPWP